MAEKIFATYSLADVATVINHPSVGKCVLSAEGGGRITISHGGDMASVTTTATGYVVINKLCIKNGTISMEIPNNSGADNFLRKLCDYVKKSKTSEFALGTMSLKDPAGNRTLNFVGVVPQREPDENYDQTAGNRQYVLIFAEMTVA